MWRAGAESDNADSFIVKMDYKKLNLPKNTFSLGRGVAVTT